MATGRFDLLRVLTVDRLHEPYRAAVYPQLPRLVEAARGAGAIGACLSGAGSTVLAFSDTRPDDHPDRGGVRRRRRRHGPARAASPVVSPRNLGAHLVKRDLTDRAGSGATGTRRADRQSGAVGSG